MTDQPTTEAKPLPIACALPDDALAERNEEISHEIWPGVIEKRELPDGYQFCFPGTDEWAQKLLHFINEERKCCRFFLFELTFEPDEGPVWLTLRGGPGTKEFIASIA